MSYTNHTTNYELPKWEATDIPSYLVDQNGAYETIDQVMKLNETAATSAQNRADEAYTLANTAKSTADIGSAKSSAALDNTANPYSATSTYNVGDYVIYNNSLYRCTVKITVAEPFTGNHWERIIVADKVKALDARPATDFELYEQSYSSTAIPSSTNLSNIGTLTIPAGTYLVVGVVIFGANATGMRSIALGDSDTSYTHARDNSTAVAGSVASRMSMCRILTFSGNTTLYLNAAQNSGGNLNVTGASLKALRFTK